MVWDQNMAPLETLVSTPHDSPGLLTTPTTPIHSSTFEYALLAPLTYYSHPLALLLPRIKLPVYSLHHYLEQAHSEDYRDALRWCARLVSAPCSFIRCSLPELIASGATTTHNADGPLTCARATAGLQKARTRISLQATTRSKSASSSRPTPRRIRGKHGHRRTTTTRAYSSRQTHCVRRLARCCW